MIINDVVEHYIRENPHNYVGKIECNGQEMWIKRRPASKKNIWHSLLHYVSYLIPLPIIYPTVVTNVADSLIKEAERLNQFAEHEILVPEVLAIQPDFLVTNDVGITLQNHLESTRNRDTRYDLLEQAIVTLGQLHKASLCHGRPSLRDMTYKNGHIYFIDLEEDPLSVMSLAEAQARDLWLLFISIARQCKDNPKILIDLFKRYLPYANSETLSCLKQMVFFLKPLRMFSEYCLFAIKSNDLRCAVLANKMLEFSFKNYSSIRRASATPGN